MTIQIKMPVPKEYRVIVIVPMATYHNGETPGNWPELEVIAFGTDGETVLKRAQQTVKGVVTPYDTEGEAYRYAVSYISGETGDCFIAILDALTDN